MAKAKESTPKNILLGYGTVTIDETPVGLTRGGSTFTIEREVRNIEADGDKGTVRGRVVIDTEEPTLTVNALELFSKEDMLKFYPALADSEEGLKSTLKFTEGDYHKVVWTGKTLGGKSVTITLPHGLNKDNLELTMEDKDEVVPELTFTGTYDEADREGSAFIIKYEEEGK